MYNRRALLSLALRSARIALIGAATSELISCASPTPTPGPTPPGPIISQTVLDDLNLILSKLQEIMPALQSFIPAAIYTKILSGLNQAEALVGSLGASGNGVTVQQVITVIEGILSDLQQAGTLPSWASIAISAIELIIPAILAAIGVTTARRAVSPAQVEQARATLRALHPPTRSPRLHR